MRDTLLKWLGYIVGVLVLLIVVAVRSFGSGVKAGREVALLSGGAGNEVINPAVAGPVGGIK